MAVLVQRAHRFVGREAELHRLTTARDATLEGQPRVLVVSGEAGVGKTRLVNEFCSGADQGLVLAGGCVELAAGELPYAPFIAALRHLPEVHEWPRMQEALGPSLDAIVRLVPSMRDRIDPGHGAPPEADRTSDLGLAQFFELMLGALDRLSELMPLVLVLEDVHWADRSTLDLLSFLAHNLRTERLLLLVTVRTEGLPRRHHVRAVLTELSRQGAERLELPGLTRPELAVLAADVLGMRPNQQLLDQLAGRSDGNPFFAEELLAGGAIPPSGSPASLTDVVLARVHELDSATVRLLRAASVIGRPADEDLLAAMCGLAVEDCAVAIRTAVDEGLMVPDGAGGVGGHRFRHSLAQEAVYQELLPYERRRLHAAAAAALDAASVEPARDAGAQAELAQHWYGAGDGARAVSSAVAAGRTAIGVLAYAEAWTWLRRALDMCTVQPELLHAAGVDRGEVLELAAEAARWLGQMKPAVEMCRQAIAEVDTVRDPVRAGVLWERLGRYLWESGDSSASIAAYKRAADLMAGQPPTAERARAAASEAAALMLTSRYGESLERAREAVELARGVGAQVEESHALATLGVDLSMLGDLPGALSALDRARALAVEADSMEDICRAYTNQSSVLEVAGRLADCADVALEGLAVARSRGLETTGGGILVGNAAGALLKLGRWDEVDALVRDVLPRLTGLMEVSMVLVQVGLSLARGQLDAAEQELSRLEDLSRSVTEPQLMGPAYVARAELALQQQDLARARLEVDKGIKLVTGCDDHQFIIRLCSLGIRAYADGVEGSRQERRGDSFKASGRGEAQALLELAQLALDKLQSCGASVAEASIDMAECEAEWVRFLGASTAGQWNEIAQAWEDLQQPFRSATARYRAAEVLVQRRKRPEAAALLRRVADSARAMGAAKLLADSDALARRARLDLSAMTKEPTEREDPFHLTRRERTVLAQLTLGRSNRQIARALFISEKTASVHVSNILTKLSATSRTEAAAIAHRRQLLSEDDLAVD